jgi:FO synthase
VLAIAREGAALGCKEALFTLGDRPEDRWHQAREWLDAHGYDDTLSYVRAMAIRVLEETGLLPHLNPGVLSWQDFQRLKPVAPSMGMMLETTAARLFTEKGGPHFGSPDKDPAVRLRVLEDAGRSNVPFTTGILIGIGETLAERADSIFAIRKVAREYGGIQEVIVQNFRAKPDTKMRDVSRRRARRPGRHDRRDQAGARPGPGSRRRRTWSATVPADPAGRHRRLGRRLAAHPGPRQPRTSLAADRRTGPRTAAAGFTLRERLTIYPPYLREPWLDPRLARARGRAGRSRHRPGRRRRHAARPALAGARRRLGQATGRTDLHVTIDTTGRTMTAGMTSPRSTATGTRSPGPSRPAGSPGRQAPPCRRTRRS